MMVMVQVVLKSRSLVQEQGQDLKPQPQHQLEQGQVLEQDPHLKQQRQQPPIHYHKRSFAWGPSLRLEHVHTTHNTYWSDTNCTNYNAYHNDTNYHDACTRKCCSNRQSKRTGCQSNPSQSGFGSTFMSGFAPPCNSQPSSRAQISIRRMQSPTNPLLHWVHQSHRILLPHPLGNLKHPPFLRKTKSCYPCQGHASQKRKNSNARSICLTMPLRDSSISQRQRRHNQTHLLHPIRFFHQRSHRRQDQHHLYSHPSVLQVLHHNRLDQLHLYKPPLVLRHLPPPQLHHQEQSQHRYRLDLHHQLSNQLAQDLKQGPTRYKPRRTQHKLSNHSRNQL